MTTTQDFENLTPLQISQSLQRDHDMRVAANLDPDTPLAISLRLNAR